MTLLRSVAVALIASGAAMALALPLAAQDETPAPKLGPNAVPMTAETTFLREQPAPDYWAFAPFVKPQFTTSACSIASVTAAVNGLRGLPALAEDTVTTQSDLLEVVGDADWASLSAEGGDGVTFDQLVQFTGEALAATGLDGATVETFHPTSNDAETLAAMKAMLAANEASADDVMLLYFNQGVVTGDWDGPHVSLIGAYDAPNDKVLILEVDQEWYIPYWTPTEVLLDAMLKPTSAEHGVLEGQTGGFVHIAK
ncbi:phytochelatin synthase family protein [Tropicimonas sp. IMCC34043]|uniref:phytochelatin synthase family protein n=1 Tax=Tropicimonas sp. IMCC34043 TaxID=2248760 RepID=UPI000E21DF69|nr:phytochelatin synthase family protein [Tropicimonas sp. IMCC34043]